jgi:hypothetical protein
VLGILELYVEDYGTNVGQGGDDTAALTACYNAAEAYNASVPSGQPRKSVIRLPPILNLNSNPVTTSGGNAIVPLRVWASGQSTSYITFRGVDAPGGSFIKTNVTGLSYSATYGPPSMIGGPTIEQLGAGKFVNTIIEMDGVTFTAPANPTICGLDLTCMQGCRLTELYCTTTSFETQPTNLYTFGVRTPECGNGGHVDIGEVYSTGFAFAMVSSTHVAARQFWGYYSVCGLGLTGDGDYGTLDGHGNHIGYLHTEECVYHIAGWSPSGPVSLPVGSYAPPVAGQQRLTWGLWDIEDGSGAVAWAVTVDHVLDANNNILGGGPYCRVTGNVGSVSGPLTVTGGQFLQLRDITVSPTPVTIDAQGAGTQASAANTITWSHTVGTLKNGVLIVAVCMTGGTLASVTFGATSLSLIGAAQSVSGNTRRIELWGAANPPAGTATVTATVAAAGTSTMTGNSVSFSNAAQTFGSIASNTSTSTQAYTQVAAATTAVTDSVLGVSCMRITAGLAPAPLRAVQLWNNVPASANLYSQATLETGHIGTVVSGSFWTTADVAVSVALVIKAAA